jgi:hypothetical protein
MRDGVRPVDTGLRRMRLAEYSVALIVYGVRARQPACTRRPRVSCARRSRSRQNPVRLTTPDRSLSGDLSYPRVEKSKRTCTRKCLHACRWCILLQKWRALQPQPRLRSTARPPVSGSATPHTPASPPIPCAINVLPPSSKVTTNRQARSGLLFECFSVAALRMRAALYMFESNI